MNSAENLQRATEALKVSTGLEKLTAQQLKSIGSYQKRIREHQEKLEAFKANPTIRPRIENLSKDVIQK